MGKKHEKKGKKKVVLSLAEFNEDAGIGGVDPELAALPNAPKAAEEWEAQGGRPEYNSRGYKERTTSSFKDRGYDDDFDDRDWSRRGPLDEGENPSGFGTGAERDWGDMRRGPQEAEGGTAPERNWNEMRRGPVDSSFDTDNASERNWGVRQGPIEAELPSRARADEDWGNARRMAVEAEVPHGKASAEQDWSVRKPIEADVAGRNEEADWSAPRKGPVEAETLQSEAEKDWTTRKGPVEAEARKMVPEADWSGVRKGPVEAETSKRKEVEVDWAQRRGPVDNELDSMQKAVREIDFTEMRRGSKLKELTEEQPSKVPQRGDTSRAAVADKEHWRRDRENYAGKRGSQDGPGQRNASGDNNNASKDRDWGAARRAQPMKPSPRFSRPASGPGLDSIVDDENTISPESNIDTEAVDDDDDWTTVRTAAQRRPVNRRSGGRGSSQHRRSGPRQSGDGRVMRPAVVDGTKVATTSPVTPITSTVSDS